VRARVDVMARDASRPAPSPPPGDVVDADYEVVDEERDDMPPPGEGWGPRDRRR
jgi:hypothetical protein